MDVDGERGRDTDARDAIAGAESGADGGGGGWELFFSVVGGLKVRRRVEARRTSGEDCAVRGGAERGVRAVRGG